MGSLLHMRGGLALAGALAALVLAAASPAAARSLYSGPGPRPGPDLLYAKPKAAPQLSNRRPFKARPILVSGATAYRALAKEVIERFGLKA